MTHLFLATEDRISEAVGTKIIRSALGPNVEVVSLSKGGNGYLKTSLHKFAEMAQRNAVLVITDLDTGACAPRLKDRWFSNIIQPERLIFRIAVREIETWLLADRQEFASFLGVSAAKIPIDPEALPDPKSALIKISRQAQRDLRLDIVPGPGVIASQGIGYNNALCRFVNEVWDCERASQNSDSLTRACRSLAAVAL